MLTPGKIYIGRVVRLSANFQVSDADTDPATVELKTRSPCGVEATYTYAAADITKTSVGDYYIDVTPDEPGRWAFKWTTTTPDDVSEGDFLVQDSPFFAWNPDYV